MCDPFPGFYVMRVRAAQLAGWRCEDVAKQRRWMVEVAVREENDLI